MYLLDQLPEEWDLGEVPRYRRDQVRDWIYQKRAASFELMTSLPKDLRETLQTKFSLSPLSLEKMQGSKDTTRKFLWKLSKGDYVESVLIPANPSIYGEKSDRLTLCVSSQVGCAYGCRFCASGLEGWKRHLTPGEIVGQIMETERATQERISNLVFMGMGEPFANFENLRKAIEMINASWGVGIGARHITISTSGLVPQIKLLADDPLQVRLAISLHGATDEVRNQIMPVNKKYPLQELMGALDYYQEKKGRMITFEYILLEGVNDELQHAEALARLAKRVFAKVNVIPYNAVEGLPWIRPSDSKIRKFADILKNHGIKITLRLEKGHDIDAACGQLRLKKVQEERV
ncbi:MAG: 23S rRNA (adenine(2503)-C(2))-methyltransferase RlmN [Verrucomicrobiota bacterium]